VGDSAGGAWKVLESLHAAREQTALKEVIAIRQQIEQCDAREKRVIHLREDYAMRLSSDGPGTVSASEFRLAHQFLTQVDGMLEVLRKQKNAMTAGLSRAMSEADKIQSERRKFEMLADSAERQARAQRARRDQRDADQTALMLYNCKRGA
jgi:flagellar export protein FliJ